MAPFARASQRHRRSLYGPDADDKATLDRHAQRDRFIMTFPVHPLPSMQGPFEESMLDATGETGHIPFQHPHKNIDVRQQQLCREPNAPESAWNFSFNSHWRRYSKGKYHPLLKTVAQIVFGVHLLNQHLEKSVADVADILLKHVNELDSFLQRANEDIEGSLKDMLFRRKCLKVPMEHVNEFDRLLDDRSYRAQLLEGNVIIERTIGRMSLMLNDYLQDMGIFREANIKLDAYLLDIGDAWTAMNEDVGRIYSAMCGNTGGWAHFLQSLVAKAEQLGVVLVQVSSYCNEIEKRCGAASRRSLITSRSSSRNSSKSRDTARPFKPIVANNKPLPTVPNERPPFLTPPSAQVERSTDTSTHHRPANERLSPIPAHPIRTVSPSRSAESLRQREVAQPTFDIPQHSGIPFTPDVVNQPSEHVQEASSSRDQNSGDVPDSSEITLRQDVYVPEQATKPSTTAAPREPEEPIQYSDEKEVPYSDEKEVVIAPLPVDIRKGKEELSPLMTGKDSAYSSISGASFASPTGAFPRSASAQASYPRAQFGLFPSSGPSTPKLSTPGRFGPGSPALRSPTVPEQSHLPPRAHSSLEGQLPSSRRLLKKSSLSSLKRLFSKRKHGSVEPKLSSVDPIAE